MSRRSIFAGLAVLAIAAFVVVGIWGPDRDWGPRHDGVEVVRVVDDQGAPIEGASTIIVNRGGGPGFPFGIFFIPLGILFFFGVLRLFSGRPHGGYPTCGNDREAWLNDWHRRQHEQSDTPPTAGTTA